MASVERQRWKRFSLNAARYALGPIGGLLVPWIVVHRSTMEQWGHVVPCLIAVQLLLHVGQWGSKDFLLKRFARGDGDPRQLAGGSLVTRALVMLPIAGLLAVLGAAEWKLAALWFFMAFAFQSFEPVLIWNKRFGVLFAADALALIAQIGTLWMPSNVTVETVLVSYVIGAMMRLFVLRWADWRIWTVDRSQALFDLSVSFNEHYLNAYPFFFIGLSGLLASRIDLYTANALLNRTEVAHYQIVASLFIQFQALAALVVAPLTRDLYRLSVASVSRYTRRMRLWALAGLVPMCAVTWCVLTFLFHLDLHWSVFAAACGLVWPVYAYVPVITQLYKHRRERSVMWANFAAATLTCALTVILLPRLGITGGLAAAAAGQWLMLVWMKREERKLHALSNV